MQEVTAPNAVKLINIEITNFYYAINSLISFTPIWGIVLVQDSTFNQLNICGSVIKNSFEASLPDVLGSVNYNYITETARAAINPILPEYNSNPASQVCSQSCYNITVDGVTVSNIPYLAK